MMKLRATSRLLTPKVPPIQKVLSTRVRKVGGTFLTFLIFLRWWRCADHRLIVEIALKRG